MCDVRRRDGEKNGQWKNYGQFGGICSCSDYTIKHLTTDDVRGKIKTLKLGSGANAVRGNAGSELARQFFSHKCACQHMLAAGCYLKNSQKTNAPVIYLWRNHWKAIGSHVRNVNRDAYWMAETPFWSTTSSPVWTISLPTLKNWQNNCNSIIYLQISSSTSKNLHPKTHRIPCTMQLCSSQIIFWQTQKSLNYFRSKSQFCRRCRCVGCHVGQPMIPRSISWITLYIVALFALEQFDFTSPSQIIPHRQHNL